MKAVGLESATTQKMRAAGTFRLDGPNGVLDLTDS
jgi:hypothetical protein